MKTKIISLAALLFASPLVGAVTNQAQIDVVVTEARKLEVQKKILSISELRELLAKEKGASVRIMSEDGVEFKTLVSVLDACRESGAMKVEIISTTKK